MCVSGFYPGIHFKGCRQESGVEAPKASSAKAQGSRHRMRRVGWDVGRGYPLRSRLGGLGSVVSSPAGFGTKPRLQTHFCIFYGHRTLLVEKKMFLYSV